MTHRFASPAAAAALACLLAIPVAAPAHPADALDVDAAIECSACERWNTPLPPLRLHGRTWYVGPRGLSVLMVATDDGLVLLDGALPQSVPLIEANLRALGHALADVRWILVSHEHFDHIGGVAALQRASGARVGASPAAVQTLQRGRVAAEDPQAGYGAAMAFPPIADVVAIADGESIEVGGVRFTAVHTPGHAAGGSSWHWQSCEQDRCRAFVYADSLNPVSHPDFRFSDQPARVATFAASIERFAALDCELMVPAHPEAGELFARALDLGDARAEDSLVDAAACRRYADAAAERLRRRLDAERAQDG